MAAWIIALHLDELPGAKIKSWKRWFRWNFSKNGPGFVFLHTSQELFGTWRKNTVCCCIAFAWVFQGEVNRLICTLFFCFWAAESDHLGPGMESSAQQIKLVAHIAQSMPWILDYIDKVPLEDVWDLQPWTNHYNCSLGSSTDYNISEYCRWVRVLCSTSREYMSWQYLLILACKYLPIWRLWKRFFSPPLSSIVFLWSLHNVPSIRVSFCHQQEQLQPNVITYSAAISACEQAPERCFLANWNREISRS